jgi:hypothetical protein
MGILLVAYTATGVMRLLSGVHWHAFLDRESRIRLNSDETPAVHTEIVAISWAGGLLDGQCVQLNETPERPHWRSWGRQVYPPSVRTDFSADLFRQVAAQTAAQC